MEQKIEIGFQAFLSDAVDAFGAVRATSPEAREVTVAVKNAGDFTLPLDAVKVVEGDKVTFDCNKLDKTLRKAIGRAQGEEAR